MEMQACIQQYAINSVDTKIAHYSQGFSQTQVVSYPTRKMKVLFSGCGKAEKNMGMADIPPLIAILSN